MNIYSEILKEITDVLNAYHNIIARLKCDRLVKGDKLNKEMKKKVKATSVNEPINAIIVRIRDISDFLKDNTKTPRTSTELVNIIIQIDVLISCVESIQCIFSSEKIVETNRVFKSKHSAVSNPKSGDENITDKEYFRYIRSIGFSHPIDTNRHPKFQCGELEWSMYVDPNNHLILQEDLQGADFYIRVCRSNSGLDKYIPLWFDEFIEYAEFYLSKLSDVLSAVNSYVENCKQEYISAIIKKPTEFSEYAEYLLYLQNEVMIRDLSVSGIIEAALIFLTDMESDYNNKILESYKQQIEVDVTDLHNNIQEMSEKQLRIIEQEKCEEIDYYDISKLEYLFPFYVCDNEELTIDILKECIVSTGVQNHSELEAYVTQAYDEEKKNNKKDFWTNSEWTRVLFHKYSNDMKQYIDLDFMKSDWNVYLQIKLYMYLRNKSF